MAVSTFDELQDAIAQLGYYNPAFDIFLRGQTSEHHVPYTSGYASLGKLSISSILPSLFRPPSDRKGLPPGLLKKRLETLDYYHDAMQTTKSRPGITPLRNHKPALWALLQHYGVCPTPLIDVTRSVRVASSFATLGDAACDRFVYAFALPYMTSNITYDFGTELMILNLRNVMPPDAKRPHYQEGFLIGSLSEDYSRSSYFNLSKRLVGKFRIPADKLSSFFSVENPAMSRNSLLPPIDPVADWLASLVPPTWDPWLAGPKHLPGTKRPVAV